MIYNFSRWFLCFFVSICAFSCASQTFTESVSPKPPMGWNSYDCFGMSVTESEVKANADFMSLHLKEYGYEYVVVDFLWFGDNFTQDNWQSKTAHQFIDESGRVIPSEKLHPSSSNGKGFKPLADYVHAKGLKFGIHLMRGIPWNAVEENLPVKGTEYRLKDIVNMYDTCKWYGGMRGINFEKPGAQEYVNSLFDLYASWGVDFVKVDDIAFPYHADDIEAIHKAIKNCGRPMVLSLSPGAAPIGSAKHLAENADMWRISPDYWDSWPALKNQFGLARAWAPYAKPGSWPDADMLPVGNLSIRSELKMNYPRKTNFSHEEQYTMLTLWSMMRSPLMIGSNLQGLDEFTLALLTNKEVLEINQQSKNGREVFSNEETIIWSAESHDGISKYVAFFNLNDSMSKTINVKLADIGINDLCSVYDIWKKEDLPDAKNGLNVEVSPHGTVLLRLIPNNKVE